MRKPLTDVPDARSEGQARRHVLPIAVGLLLVTTAAAGLYAWRSMQVPEPPRPDRAQMDADVAKALEDKRAEVMRNPRAAKGWGSYGMLLLAQQLRAESLVCFAQAEQLDAGDARWPYLCGVVLARSDAEAAIGPYRRAAELAGTTWDAPRLRLADLLLVQGHTEEAWREYQRLLEADPKHPRAHLGLARLALERADSRAAQEHLRECLFDAFSVKAARMIQAALYRQQGDLAAAAREEDMVARLEKDPDWPDPVLNEVYSLRLGADAIADDGGRVASAGDSARAIDILRRGIKKYPDKQILHLQLGEVLAKNKQYAQAERALLTAIRLGPDVAAAHYSLGRVRFDQKKYAAATEALREATKLVPDHEAAHYYLGECLKHLGDPAGAIAEFKTGIRFRPNDPNAHKSLGELLSRSGQKEDALVHLRLAVELNPADAEAKAWLEQLQREGRIPAQP